MSATLAGLLAAATARLSDAGIPSAPRDARLLLAHAAGLPADRLTLHLGDPAAPEVAERLQRALAARAARQPVSQITGRRLFWGRSFEVTPDVLDPRPETETLIALALEAEFARLLDLGTGTGILAITLLAERPAATGLATDLSAAALAVAARNADRHGVADRLALHRADWCAGLEGRFDLILSNPPYIPAAEIATLAPEVRDHEPRGALTDGGDGLSAYAAIARDAPGHLRPGGRLMVEVGPGQAETVAGLFSAAGLAAVAVHPDMDGRGRVVSARAG